MNNYIKILFVAIVLILSQSCKASKAALNDSTAAPESISGENVRANVVGRILNHYSDWGSCEINGKLRAEGLPLSPSLKIYMKKADRLVISARAPFVGEAFRLDIDRDSIMVVNRLNKTYCLESTQRLQEIYPGVISDLQSVLLGRIVIPGRGVLSRSNSSDIDVIAGENGEWVLSPDLASLQLPVDIAYVVKDDGTLSAIAAGTDENNIVTISYSWKSDNVDAIDIQYEHDGRTTVASIDLDSPKWGAEPFAEAKITSKFKRLSIVEFVKKSGLK